MAQGAQNSSPNSRKSFLIDLVKVVVSSLLALAVGLFGLVLLFSDLGPGESYLSRYSLTFAGHLFFGFLFGLVNPRVWPFSGLVAWGGILIALRSAIAGPQGWPDAATVVGLAPLPAVGGGYLGRLVAGRWRRRNLSSPPGGRGTK